MERLRRASLEEFAENRWFWCSEADVGSLWNASLCREGRLGLFSGSEADVMGPRGASL